MTPLGSLLDDLERMATWKEDLAARLWRAQVRAEYAGLPAAEQEQLRIEVESFTEVTLAFAQRITGSLTDQAANLRLDNSRRAA